MLRYVSKRHLDYYFALFVGEDGESRTKSYEDVKAIFQEHYIPSKSELFFINDFFDQSVGDRIPFDEFLSRLTTSMLPDGKVIQFALPPARMKRLNDLFNKLAAGSDSPSLDRISALRLGKKCYHPPEQVLDIFRHFLMAIRFEAPSLGPSPRSYSPASSEFGSIDYDQLLSNSSFTFEEFIYCLSQTRTKLAAAASASSFSFSSSSEHEASFNRSPSPSSYALTSRSSPSPPHPLSPRPQKSLFSIPRSMFRPQSAPPLPAAPLSPPSGNSRIVRSHSLRKTSSSSPSLRILPRRSSFQQLPRKSEDEGENVWMIERKSLLMTIEQLEREQRMLIETAEDMRATMDMDRNELIQLFREKEDISKRMLDLQMGSSNKESEDIRQLKTKIVDLETLVEKITDEKEDLKRKFNANEEILRERIDALADINITLRNQIDEERREYSGPDRKKRREEAALMIQRNWRKWVAMKNYEDMKFENQLLNINSSDSTPYIRAPISAPSPSPSNRASSSNMWILLPTLLVGGTLLSFILFASLKKSRKWKHSLGTARD